MKNVKVAIATTHPIQYQTPWFQALSQESEISLTVFFGMMPNAEQQSTGFGTNFSWDIPLTDNYNWQLLENIASSPSLSSFSGVDCPKIYNELKHFNPDAIIITGWHSKFLLQTLYAARRLNIPIIMRGESNDKKTRPRYISLLHRILLSQCAAFLAIGKSNTRFFSMNGVRPEKIFDAPYFIENTRFVKGTSSTTNTTRDVDSVNLFSFIYAGKLIEKKNVQELLEAFALTYKNHDSIQMIVIGDGELKTELKNFVAKHRLPVTFCGFVNQKSLPETYALGNCFLLGSDYDETWGLVVNEAMACGLPAIVSNRAGCSDDLIIEGKTGFTYQYGNPKELSKKMNLMIENKDKAREMGIAAQQHVLEHYDVKISTQATMNALRFLGL